MLIQVGAQVGELEQIESNEDVQWLRIFYMIEVWL